jgi:glutamate synthase domain-containing protein 3
MERDTLARCIQENCLFYALIEEHYERTQSKKAAMILDNWEHESQYFCKVVSPEYQRIYTMHKTKQAVEVRGG